MDDLNTSRTITGNGLSVTVRPATYRMGLTRTILMGQVQKARAVGEMDAIDLAAAFGEEMIYPSLIAATVEHEGFEHWPITAQEFLDLPEAFGVEWEAAVFALNPHWRAQPASPESAEKKAPIGSEP